MAAPHGDGSSNPLVEVARGVTGHARIRTIESA
jgi:hypothetical protein